MTHHGRLALLAVLGSLILVSAPHTLLGGEGEQPQPGISVSAEKLDMIQKQLKTLADSQKKQFGDLNEQLADSFTAVKTDIEKLQKDIKHLKGDKTQQELKLQKLQDQVQGLEEAMGQVQAGLEALKNKAHINLYGPNDKAEWIEMKARLDQLEKLLLQLKSKEPYIAKPPPAGACKVRLINNTTEDVTYRLNGKMFRVLSGGMTTEVVPAGPLSYEVYFPGWGLIKQKTTVVQPNEVFNITVG